MAFDDGKKLKIFSGSANPKLAKEICEYLGLPLGEALIGRFNNGEVQVMIEKVFAVRMYSLSNQLANQRMKT